MTHIETLREAGELFRKLEWSAQGERTIHAVNMVEDELLTLRTLREAAAVPASTTIKLESCDYWADCECGHSMRVPSPNNSRADTKMPIFCCGCGKKIIYTGQHRWLPHEFIRGIILGCGLCALGPSAQIHTGFGT